jgi:hypothetical protein
MAMRKIIFGLLFLILTTTDPANADGFSSFFRLSRYEKWWVISHPFVAHRAFKITNEARLETEIVLNDSLLDHDPFGGQVDAFRHSYWMARLAQEMRWKKALRLGKAHEKGNYLDFKKKRRDEEGLLPDSVSGAMDLFNNQVGVSIGCNLKAATKAELITEIKSAIRSGKMKVIRKNSAGKSMKCNGEIINDAEFVNIWNIPKCLVSSDFGI